MVRMNARVIVSSLGVSKCWQLRPPEEGERSRCGKCRSEPAHRQGRKTVPPVHAAAVREATDPVALSVLASVALQASHAGNLLPLFVV